jgi:hypothetical protein
MLSRSIWSKTDMASDLHGDQRAVSEPKPATLPSSAQPQPQSPPPIFSDGPETLRSNDC